MEGNEKSTQVQVLMTSIPLQTATSEDTVETISNKMKENQVGSVVVVNEKNHPLGIVTERDIVRRVISDNKDPKHTKATEVMSTPLITTETNTYVYDVSVKMVKNKIRRLPVVKDKTLSGIVTITDIIKYFHEKNKENDYLSKAMIRYGKYWEE